MIKYLNKTGDGSLSYKCIVQNQTFIDEMIKSGKLKKESWKIRCKVIVNRGLTP